MSPRRDARPAARRRAVALPVALWAACLAAAASPAAASRLAPDPGRTYEAAYFYALACLAGDQGAPADQAALLARAQVDDPDSLLLARDRARTLMTMGRSREAAAVLAAALRTHPGDEALRHRLAGLYQALGDHDRARALFLRPGGGDPKDPSSLRALAALDLEDGDNAAAARHLRALGPALRPDDRELLGLALQRQGRWGDARAQYLKVLAVDPRRDAVWAQLSGGDAAAGDTPAARADLESGVRASPRSPVLWDQLGRLLYADKDYAGADRAFGTLAHLDPGDAHVLLFRGLSRLKENRLAPAEADFRAACRIEPKDPDAMEALALTLVLERHYAAAGDRLRAVLRLNPQSVQAWEELAFVDGRLHGSVAAAKLLGRALRAVPGDRDLMLLLAAADQEAGRVSDEIAVLKKALGLKEDPDARFELAAALDAQGHFHRSETELLRVVAEAPRDAEALNYLGYSWAERGERLPQAEALIRRALAVDPRNPYYLDSLGWVLHRLGRDAQARTPLEDAALRLKGSRDTSDAVVFDHLAAVEKDLGDRQAAVKARAEASAIRSRARRASRRRKSAGKG